MKTFKPKNVYYDIRQASGLELSDCTGEQSEGYGDFEDIKG